MENTYLKRTYKELKRQRVNGMDLLIIQVYEDEQPTGNYLIMEDTNFHKLVSDEIKVKKELRKC